MTPRTVLITGAAGVISKAVRPILTTRYTELRLLDQAVVSDPAPNERVIVADIRDVTAMARALAGVDCVLHLAAIPDEDSWARIRDANIDGTYGVFEAARQAGVGRVVFASSHHVAGLSPLGTPVAVDDPPRPSGLYGVSKVFGEALGRLYAEKFGLSVICLRIAAYAPAPPSYRHRLLWISPGDTARLCHAAIDAPSIRFLVLFGTSNNRRNPYDRRGWSLIGYAPEDDAEAFADSLPDRPIAPGDRFNGGETSIAGLVEN